MQNRKLDRRTKYSLMAIRTALFELLKDKELRAITVTDICRVADVNRGTFYKYYRDVPDLFSQIEDTLVEEASEIIEKNCLAELDLEGLFSHILILLSENQDFITLEKNALNSQPVKKLLQLFRPQLLQAVITLMPDITDEDADMVFEFILGGVCNTIISWIHGGMKMSKNKMQKMLVHLMKSLLQNGSGY